MNSLGECSDSAPSGSSLATLECELLDRSTILTRAEPEKTIPVFTHCRIASRSGSDSSARSSSSQHADREGNGCLRWCTWRPARYAFP